jgi:GxxExxY protein
MPYGETTTQRIEEVAREIVDAAFKVHSTLGPGLLESVYQTCLAFELARRNLLVLKEFRVPIIYEGVRIATDLRIDLLVEDCVIVEVKAVEKLIPIFRAKALTYLKLADKRLCLLINFNVEQIKDGIRRVIL